MHRPAHVLFIIPSLKGGGAQRVFVTLLKNFDRSELRATLCVVNAEQAVFAENIPRDVEIIDLSATRLRHVLLKILWMIWRIRPDVVVSTQDYLNVGLAATRFAWPPSVGYIARPAIITRSLDKRLRWFMAKTLPVCDRIIMQSQDMMEVFRRSLEWTRENLVVIPNPIDIDGIRRAVADESVETGYRDGQINLVSAGRLEPQKGFDLLLQAVARMENENFNITILGDGADRLNLEQMALDLNIGKRVRFLGFQNNPYPFFAKADGFVLSSRYEGFPNVVLEALACGTPVVSTPVEGIHEVLGGISGCRTAVAVDAGSISDALSTFIEGGMGRVAPEAVERYDHHRIVRLYEDVILNVAEQRSATNRSTKPNVKRTGYRSDRLPR